MTDVPLIETQEDRVFYRDSFDWIVSSRDVYKSAALTGGFVFILSFGLSFFESALLIHKLIYAFFAAFVTFILIFLISILTMMFCHMRLTPDQWIVKWEFFQSNLKIMDKTGLTITIPWSQIKTVSFKNRGVCFYTQPKGSRWLPKRLLTLEQWQELRALSENKVG